MSWRIRIAVFVLLAMSCKDPKANVVIEDPIKAVSDESYYANYQHLIEIEEFRESLDDSELKIIDFRKPDSYAGGHIKSAINIWRTDIEDQSFPYKGKMASKTQVEALFSQLGIKDSDTLVIYDDNGSCDASRLWWILKNYGFENTKILNGGLHVWKLNDGEVTLKINPISPSFFKFKAPSNMNLHTGLDEMIVASQSKNDVIILDTRSNDEYSGKQQKNGASSGGRIPNSILIDWASTIDYNGSKKFKPYNELIQLYELQGVSKDNKIRVYCHSGVRSAHTTFVLTELLGFKNVKNYDGSWIEWSYHKDLLIEKDSLTTIFK